MTSQKGTAYKWLEKLVSSFSESPIPKIPGFRQFIVTGSYADWLKDPSGASSPSWKAIPDINLYVLVSESEEKQATFEYELGRLYNEMLQKDPEVNLMLDLHPFSRSIGTVSPCKFNLQLTSRVINMRNASSYPDYCWYGWKSNYINLYSKDNKDWFSKFHVSAPTRDFRWLKHMYMAFASYSNVMHMIALSSIYSDSLTIFDESYRYCKEIMKDGISLGIPVYIDDDFNYSVIKYWKAQSDRFYDRFYGPDEAKIVSEILSIEKDYFAYRNEEYAKKLLNNFFILKEAIFEKGFKARMVEICGCSDIMTFLPLWY